MHYVERKQDTLTSNFTETILKDASTTDAEYETLNVQIRSPPVVDNDESFASLATRIVEEVISTTSPKSLTKQVLEQVGISTSNEVAEPKVYNGHLRHVGRRARKLTRQQNTNQTLKVRRVKRTNRGPPPNLRRMGAPQQTRTRPPLGMEDELRISARDSANSRGKTKKKRRLFRR